MSQNQQPYFPSPSGEASQGVNTAAPGMQTIQQPVGQGGAPPLPPKMQGYDYTQDDVSSPVHYTRDPHKLVAYLVPFPTPNIKGVDPSTVPMRFLIYTPPPPPIPAPAEGEKEGKAQKLQRKWQDEVRAAKTSDAKVASWKGVKGRVTKGVDWAMNQTKSSNLEFLNRIPGNSKDSTHDAHADDGHPEGDETKKTIGLEEMVLIYPSTLPGTQEQLREEFVNSMLRTKSKAQKDAVIATGLIPVSFAVDILATLVWPFGGLGEIDTVWAVASIRGAKTARSVTKRLHSSDTSTGGSSGGELAGTKKDEHELQLTFTPSPRLDILTRYLATECHLKDAKLFKSAGPSPTDTQAIDAIGWSPSQAGGETKNWEDEQWEIQQVKDDLKSVMHKGAREWNTWCKAYEKDPQKAMKK